MTPGRVRAAAVALGVCVALAGGALAGGWWWLAAVIAVAAALAAPFDTQVGLAHVIALVGLAAGLDAVGRLWYVPILVAGSIASIELHAAADRVTAVRRTVPGTTPAAVTFPVALGLAFAVLLVAALPTPAVAGAAVLSAGAVVVATRVIAR